MQFKDIIGQRELINQLTQIIDSGRVSNTQLFLGKNGYGSMAMAIAYAQYLNCQNRQHFSCSDPVHELRADSCGECPSCRKYRQLQHSDLHFVFPTATNTKITKDPSAALFQGEFREFMLKNNLYGNLNDWYEAANIGGKVGKINTRDAANIIEELSLKTYESEFKVVIIWMVEALQYDAAPRLLKTLEEPAENTVVILIAEEQDQILSTILSRAQRVVIPRIDSESLFIALEGQLPSNPEEASSIVMAAEGDIIQAHGLLCQKEWDAICAEQFVKWMRLLFKLNMSELSKWVDNISSDSFGREKRKLFLRYASEVIRACFLKNNAGIDNPYTLRFGDEKFEKAFPTMITMNNVEKLQEALSNTIYAIERNSNSKITFMDLSFTISKLLKRK